MLLCRWAALVVVGRGGRGRGDEGGVWTIEFSGGAVKLRPVAAPLSQVATERGRADSWDSVACPESEQDSTEHHGRAQVKLGVLLQHAGPSAGRKIGGSRRFPPRRRATGTRAVVVVGGRRGWWRRCGGSRD